MRSKQRRVSVGSSLRAQQAKARSTGNGRGKSPLAGEAGIGGWARGPSTRGQAALVCQPPGMKTKNGAGPRKPVEGGKELLSHRSTYLTHDVLIVRQSQAQVSNVPIIALIQQRRGKCWDPAGHILEGCTTSCPTWYCVGRTTLAATRPEAKAKAARHCEQGGRSSQKGTWEPPEATEWPLHQSRKSPPTTWEP